MQQGECLLSSRAEDASRGWTQDMMQVTREKKAQAKGGDLSCCTGHQRHGL